MHAVVAALRTLGHEVEYATEDAMRRGGRCILWGINNVTEDPGAAAERMEQIPRDAIVFQSEQISAVKTPSYFIQSWLQKKNYTVWDYASTNVVALKGLGLTGAVLCPLGYHPSMTRMPVVDKDIDVLFYGTRGGRRREILNALDESGLNVVQMYGKFGAERDEVIARAKVVVNLHYYQNGVFEIFRCSHLFANRVCVVNEAGGRDPELEDLARRCTSYTEREHIIDECRRLVGDDAARAEIGERALEEFKKVDLTENVREALVQSEG